MGDFQDYQELIKEVEIVNPNAALYLKGEEVKGLKSFIKSRYIDFCFDKEETPQGKEYWELVRKQIDDYKSRLRCKHNILGYKCSTCGDDPKYKLSQETGIFEKKENNNSEYEIIMISNTPSNYIFEKNGIKYKRCYKCAEVKELNNKNFVLSTLVKHGYENQCRECKRKYAKDRHAKKKESNKKVPYNDYEETDCLIFKDDKCYSQSPGCESRCKSYKKEIETDRCETITNLNETSSAIISKKNIESNLNEIIISENRLDLTEMIKQYPEVYEELKIQAMERMRPIEHHALWLIKVSMDSENINLTKR